MLDTNVFNDVLDGRIEIASLKTEELIATHVQRDEINGTREVGRRDALNSIFGALVGHDQLSDSQVNDPGTIVPTESAVWDVSRWGMAKWGADDGRLEQLRLDLDKLNKKKKNNPQDTLIAETAIRNGYVLVTADSDLFAVVTKHGGACMNVSALLAVS